MSKMGLIATHVVQEMKKIRRKLEGKGAIK